PPLCTRSRAQSLFIVDQRNNTPSFFLQEIWDVTATDSSDFPIVNAFQSSNGGLADAFVTKISGDGLTVLYSTYLGGIDDDVGTGLCIDDVNQVYITGLTFSSNFPLRRPLQSKIKGFGDAFVSKLNSSGSRLVFSTYIGGDSPDFGGGQDFARSIAVDSTRNIWVTGFTTSKDFPLKNPFQGSIMGTFDAFVLKLNRRGSRILFSSYLGGNSFEDSLAITLDSVGNAYITGITHSQDFPLVNSMQQFNGGKSVGDDAFVTVIDKYGTNILFSTYLGGRFSEFGSGISVLGQFIYVCGFTSSDDFPVVSPFQLTKKGNLSSNDAFVAKISLIP
ncbi:SBBP repeat-containing protein, partial [bacterium]|nr:SBBP repeat-containing protein [bacterium]